MAHERTRKLIAAAALITLCSVVIASLQSFSAQNIAVNDDEGTLMIIIKRFLDGRALYSDMVVFYGPLYYFYEWCAHVISGAAVSHESIRVISLCFSVACALTTFALVYKATRSLLVATAAHALAVITLIFIAYEPGHPEELCLLLLLGFGLSACAIRRRIPLMMILGALAAGMALTKINLGVFAVMALTLAVVASLTRGWPRAALLGVASAAAIVFPFLLMWSHHTEWWAMKFALITSVSVGAAAVAVWPQRFDPPARLTDFIWASIGFSAAAVAIAIFPIAHGSTALSMIDALILAPQRSFGKTFFLEARIPNIAVPWALLGIVMAVVTTWRPPNAQVIALMKFLLALGVGFAVAKGFWHEMIGFAPPFLWLAMVQPAGTRGVRLGSFARAVLTFTAVIQILYAYPAAGGQMIFAWVMITCVAGICLAESLPVMRVRYRLPETLSSSSVWVRLPAAALVVIYLSLTASAIRGYAAGRPLGLPGTAHMRIEPPVADTIQAVVQTIDSSRCSMLASAPGMFSFNFLTGRPAPSRIHFGSWMLDMALPEQEETILELSRERYPCVLYSQPRIDFWTHGADVSASPLIRYIRSNFETVSSTAGFDLMEPRDRAQRQYAAGK